MQVPEDAGLDEETRAILAVLGNPRHRLYLLDQHAKNIENALCWLRERGPVIDRWGDPEVDEHHQMLRQLYARRLGAALRLYVRAKWIKFPESISCFPRVMPKTWDLVKAMVTRTSASWTLVVMGSLGLFMMLMGWHQEPW